jgi:hypothetical protein
LIQKIKPSQKFRNGYKSINQLAVGGKFHLKPVSAVVGWSSSIARATGAGFGMD